MNRVCLLGGGRWSRVLMPVLRELIPVHIELVWITRFGFDQASELLGNLSLKNVRITVDEPLRSLNPSALIIANTPALHYQSAREALLLSIPTLCEKPIALHLHQAEQLADLAMSRAIPLGINLEFLLADFVQRFAECTRHLHISTIRVEWLDPWMEYRHADVKYAEIHSDIVHDMFPHCWSILRALRCSQPMLQIDSVVYSPKCVTIRGSHDGFSTEILVSRRSPERVRKIYVNHNEAILDFTSEPGTTCLFGKFTTNSYMGIRPLSGALQCFLKAIQNPTASASWPLSIHTCIDVIRLAERAFVLHSASQFDFLDSLRRQNRADISHSEYLEVLADLLLPELAMQGHRIPFWTKEDQKLHANELGSLARARYIE